MHGAVRSTVDIDFILRWNQENLKKAESAFKSLGLVSLHPLDASAVYQQREQLTREKNLIAWHFYNPKNMTEAVDVLINSDLSDWTTVNFVVQDACIHVISKLDLIAMKKASGRRQDLEDIAALEKIND